MTPSNQQVYYLHNPNTQGEPPAASLSASQPLFRAAGRSHFGPTVIPFGGKMPINSPRRVTADRAEGQPFRCAGCGAILGDSFPRKLKLTNGLIVVNEQSWTHDCGRLVTWRPDPRPPSGIGAPVSAAPSDDAPTFRARVCAPAAKGGVFARPPLPIGSSG